MAELEPHDWQFRSGGQIHAYRTRILSNHGRFEEKEPYPDSMEIFGGFGEGELSLRIQLDRCAQLGIRAVAPVLDPKQLPLERNHARDFISAFGINMTEAVQQQGASGPKTTAAGHSKGGGGLILALAEQGLFGDIGLIEPAGASIAALRHKYPDATIAQLVFLKRMGQVVGDPFYADSIQDKLIAGVEIGRQIMHSTFGRMPPGKGIWEQFSLPVSHEMDGMPDVLDHAADGNIVAISVGEVDPLIVPSEVSWSIVKHIGEYTDSPNYTPAQIAAIKRNLRLLINEGHGHMHIASDGGELSFESVADLIYPASRRTPGAEPLSLGRRVKKNLENHFMDPWFDGFAPLPGNNGQTTQEEPGKQLHLA